MRTGRSIRRRQLNATQKEVLFEVKALLSAAVTMIMRLDNPTKEDIAKRLSMGLAFDPALLAGALGDLAEEAKRSHSKESVLAYEVARRAFSASLRLRDEIPKLVREADERTNELEELATVQTDQVLRQYRDEKIRVDLPPSNFLIAIRSITPVNGPNNVIEAHQTLGHNIRKAA
jgi:hypothetical protein